MGEIVISKAVMNETNSPTVVEPWLAWWMARVMMMDTPMAATTCVIGVMRELVAMVLSTMRRSTLASLSKRASSKSAASKVRTTRQARALSSTVLTRRCCDSYWAWPTCCSRFCTRLSIKPSSGMLMKDSRVSCQFRYSK